MRQQPLEAKRVAEDIFVFFNFFDQVVWEESLSAPIVAIESYSGNDTSPSAMLSGPPIIDELQVVQKITQGMAGCLYLLTATVIGSSGTTYKVTQDLAVLSQEGFAIGSEVTLTGILPDGVVGAFYSHSLTISGGYLPYEPVGLISGAPPWMGFTVVGNLLVCSGLPAEPATTNYSFAPAVLDAAQTLAPAPQALTIFHVFITGNAPGGFVGDFYDFTYTFGGGTAPYSFSIISGTIPPGTVLNTSTARISGTLTSASVSSWVIKVTDVNGITDSIADSATIVSPFVNVLAARQNIATILTSPDSITWPGPTLTPGLSAQVEQLINAWGGKLFWISQVGARYSTDNGANWNNCTGLPLVTPRSMLQLQDGGDYFYFVTSGTLAYRSSDGISWTSFTIDVNRGWYGSISHGSVIMVASTNGVIRRSENAGATWASVTATGFGASNVVNFADSGTAIVIHGSANSCPMNRSIDQGLTWSSITWPGTFSIQKLLYIPSLARFVAMGSDGAIYISDDNGLTFTLAAAGGTTGVSGNSLQTPAAIFANGQIVTFGGASVNNIVTSPTGITWTNRFNSPQRISCIDYNKVPALFYETVSLLHMDGLDGGTTFTDVKGPVWVRPSSPVVTTSNLQVMFGSAAMKGVPASGNSWLSLTNNQITSRFCVGDFTVEAWVYAIGPLSGVQSCFSNAGANPNAFEVDINANGSVYVSSQTGGGADRVPVSGVGVFTPNQYHHVAYVRYGTRLMLFIDGVKTGEGTWVDTYGLQIPLFQIGTGANTGQELNGYVDEWRATIGARYIRNFTPAGPFSDSA